MHAVGKLGINSDNKRHNERGKKKGATSHWEHVVANNEKGKRI
jgi:hypothetical protein